MANSGPEGWSDGERYEQYMGRWSRRMAVHFLAWLSAPSGLTWLDVACGTGALSQAILARCDPASLVGVDRSPGFVAHATETTNDPRATFRTGDALALPVENGAFDVVVSGLALNFFPDANQGVTEMARAAVPGGHVALYVWDYAGGMEWLRRFWDAAIAVNPGARSQDQAERFPICKPDALRACLEGAGLVNVEVTALDHVALFADFDAYWAPFAAAGPYPAPTYLAACDPAEREAIRQRLAATLPIQADGSIALSMRAWAVRGSKP